MDSRTIVVTGGTQGFGPALARRFGQGGAHVVMAGLDREVGDQRVVEELRREGLSVAFQRLDVRDPAQSRALVERLVAEHSAIDVWVNNADVTHARQAETLPPEAWEDNLTTVLSGAFYCAQAVGAHMLARGQGVIVNIASVSAFQAIAGGVADSTAKAGLVMLTRALGIEWAARGVRVVGIAPGAVLTDQNQPSIAPGTARTILERRTPLRRLGTVEEIAEAVFFMASSEASFVVGETMRVDGGWVAYHLF